MRPGDWHSGCGRSESMDFFLYRVTSKFSQSIQSPAKYNWNNPQQTMTFQTWLGSWPKWENTGALFWKPQTPPQIPLFLYHSTKYVPFIVQKPNISCIWREISTQDHAGGVGWIEGRSGSIPWNPYGFMSHSPNLNVTGIKKKSILSLRPQPDCSSSKRMTKWRIK